jgi:acylphosphatase
MYPNSSQQEAGVVMAVSGERVRAHVFISGRVQGVNFRTNLRDQARRAEVEGWVRNLPDRRVEAIFEGSRAAVQRLVSWCYSGPTTAEVEHVEVEWEQATNREGPFGIVW